MKPNEAEKLLGGYATGSLTSEERQLLFTAALEDQRLFEALADEEALRDALSDDAFKQELIAALSEHRPSLTERLTAWWQRPYSLALAGGVAAVLLAAVIVQQMGTPDVPVQQVAMVEHKEEPAQPAEPPPVAAPVSADTELAEPRKEAAAKASAPAQPAPARAMFDEVTPAAPVSPPPPPVAAMEERIAVSRLRQAASEPAGAVGGRLALQAVAGEGERAVLSGLRHTIERAAEGVWVKVGTDTVLGLSDTVRLRVEADVTGFLQVTENSVSLFNGSVAAGGVYLIPSLGGLPAPAQAGPRTFLLVLRGARTGVEHVTLHYGER